MALTTILKTKGFELFNKIQRNTGITMLPPLIIWEATWICNFRCSFCGLYGKDGFVPNPEKELTLDQVKTVLINMGKDYIIKKPHIAFTGGDVFMRKDFVEILDLVHSAGYTYSMTTNGFLLDDEKCKKLADTGCNEIRISLHGPPEINDPLVNVPNAFNKVTEKIKLLRSYGLPVLINFVITDENVDHMQFMVDLAKELDTVLRFQHLEFVETSQRIGHAKVTKDLFGNVLPVKYGSTRLSKESVEKFKEFFKTHPTQLYEPLLKFEDIDRYYFDMSYVHSPYCFQIWGTARVDPIGRVYPCIDYFYGNLLDNTLKEIWFGEKAEKFRSEVKKRTMFPACRRCCKL